MTRAVERLAVMPRCVPACASCASCQPGAPLDLAVARRAMGAREIVLGGGDATRWPALDPFLREVAACAPDARPRVWLEAPASAFSPPVLARLAADGVHGVVVQIEGVGEKLLRTMRAGDGERAIRDAEGCGLETRVRVVARPATFRMVLPLALRLAPRPIALELVREDWGKAPVPMVPDVLSELLARAPNVSFSGHRALEGGYLPPCALPGAWARRPAAFRSTLSDEPGEVENDVFPTCATCTLRTRCHFRDAGAIGESDRAALVPVAETDLPWARARSAGEAVPAWITSKRRAPAVICTTPWTTMEVVDPDGRVRQCCTTWTVGDRGNVRDGLLSEIWNGPGYQAARRQMASADLEPLCHGICSRLHDRRFAEEALRIVPGTEAFVKNQLLLAEDVAERREVVRGKPLELAICPSTYCNYDCIMCVLGRTPRRELPESIWDELPSLLPTLRTLTLLGGEPLANPSAIRFLRDLDVARTPDLAVDLVTNGALLGPAILERLERCALGDVTVSLNAGTPEVYERVQRGLGMAAVLANLDALLDLRRRARRRFGVTVGFVVQPAASSTLIAFGELAHARNLRIRLMALNVEEVRELDFYGDADAVARVLADVDGFAAWAERTRPEWLAEIHAVRAAVASEAASRTARRDDVRRLPVV